MAEDKPSRDLARFFDEWSVDYDAGIERCVPRYREMLWALLYYIPEGLVPRTIVELGPGSGNLTALHAAASPAAAIHLVDLSLEMLGGCRERLAASRPEPITFHHADFLDVEFAEGSVDLVTSSIAIHHLDDAGKRTLFARVHEWLRPGGAFVYSDQFAGVDEPAYRQHLDAWRVAAFEKGATEEQWRAWMLHQEEHDFHASLPAQLEWLHDAGFSVVDCPWRHLLWTVLVARKTVD